MKKLLIIAISLLLGTPFLVHAVERISDFNIHLEINRDGSLDVSETIVYDFGSDTRHGIFRDIPISYRTSIGTHKLRIRDIAVRYEYDLSIPFETSRIGDSIRVKIGDPNKTVTGAHTYNISYVVEGALKFHVDQVTLAWNMIGNEWQVPIGNVTGGVVLPESIPLDDLIRACYRGGYGSTEPCRSMQAPADAGQTRGIMLSDGFLGVGQGVTVQLSFPAGIVEAPTTASLISAFISDNWPVSLPIIAFVLMWYLWRTRGRDPKGRGIIITEYDPPAGLTPAQVGGIVDEKVHYKDIAAEIIELAVKGYLRVRQDDKKDYTLFQLRPVDDTFSIAQKQLFEGFFNTPEALASSQEGAIKQVQLKDLKNKFASTLNTVKTSFETSLVSQGYYPARPNLVRSSYVGFAVILSFVVSLLPHKSVIALVSVYVTSVIILAFGWVMPRRTYKGVLAREKILGFKEYLRVVETERLKFHNAPEKKPEVFERCLPYAMVLGVEKQWAEQFKDIYTQEPNWYQGTQVSGFNSIIFANNLSSFASHANSVLASTPSGGGGGGGGFSGGGFGGGGGGSW